MVAVVTPGVLPLEPALGVEYLTNNPGTGVRHQPGDEAGRIVRLSRSPSREVLEKFLRSVVEVAGVDGSGVDGVEHDSRRSEVGGDRGSRAGEGGLRDRVGQVVAHRSQLLARRHPDDSTAGASDVSCGEGLGHQERCPSVDCPVSVIGLCGGIADRYRVASMGVVAHQDVEGAEGITRRGDELLAGRRLGEIAGQRHHTTRSGCSFADLFDQPVDVVGAAVGARSWAT